MSNPAASHGERGEDPIDYYAMVCEQLDQMQSNSDLAILYLCVPSKHAVDSSNVDISSWPELRQAYAAITQDSPSNATMMIPTFLRAVADLIDRKYRAGGQHADTQPQPLHTQQPSDVNQEWVFGATDLFAQANVGGAQAHHGSSTGAEMPANAAVTASIFPLAAQGPPTHPNLYAGLLTPPAHARHPESSIRTPQPPSRGYPPIPNTEGSKEQAEKPANSAASFHPYSHVSVTPTYPALQSNASFYTPEMMPANIWAGPHSGQLPIRQLPHFDAGRPAGAPNSPAPSSTHTGYLNIASESTVSAAPPNHPNAANPFARQVQTSAGSMDATRQRSASFQGPSFPAVSMGSQGSGHVDRSSARIAGRRPMGGLGRLSTLQNSTAPTGGTHNSNSNSDLMEM